MAVALEEVVGGGDQAPLGPDGGSAASVEAVDAAVVFGVGEDRLDELSATSVFGTRSPHQPMLRITDKRVLLGLRGAPGRIRTCDLRIRSPLLYPAELRGPAGPWGPARSGRPDSNRRPFGPKPNALPGCATPRLRTSMAVRAEGDIEQALADAVQDSSSRRTTRRGGSWGPCLHALATASWSCSRSWPSRRRRRQQPTRVPPARARAASERCADADALPGQAAGDDLRDATLCLMNAERTARGLGRLQAEPLLGRVAAGYARQMVRGRFFDHTSPGGSTMLARIKATSYLRDVGLVVGGREPRVGHRRAGHAARDGARVDALARSPRQPAGPPLRRRRHRRGRGRADRAGARASSAAPT